MDGVRQCRCPAANAATASGNWPMGSPRPSLVPAEAVHIGSPFHARVGRDHLSALILPALHIVCLNLSQAQGLEINLDQRRDTICGVSGAPTDFSDKTSRLKEG